MITEGTQRYNHLLKELDIDTGKLNFHLRALHSLIIKDEKGLYQLTDEGWKAISIPQTVPESIEEASPARRTVAYFCDFVCVLGAYSIYLIFPGLLRDIPLEALPVPYHLLAFILTFWMYFTLFESKSGQTLGKALLNLRVVGPVTMKNVFLRSFPKACGIVLLQDVLLGIRCNTTRFMDAFMGIKVTI